MICKIPLSDILGIINEWKTIEDRRPDSEKLKPPIPHTWEKTFNGVRFVMSGTFAYVTFRLYQRAKLTHYRCEVRRGEEVLRRQKTSNGFIGFYTTQLQRNVADGADTLTFWEAGS